MKIFGYMCAPDGVYPWRQDGTRKVDLGYYRQLASAYDQLGYTGALFATGAHGGFEKPSGFETSSVIPFVRF